MVNAVRSLRLPVALALAALGTSACAARYAARGVVVEVDRQAATMTVSHDPVAGFMDAMVMPFRVSAPESLAGVKPGDRVSFRITVRRNRTTVDRLRLLSAAAADQGMLLSPAAPALVTIGEPVPDFTLTDHRGERVSLADQRGKVVALTFIYTRCPLPDYCPRMVTNLRAVRDRFADRMGRDLALMTVTFDPQYDTAEELARFAQIYRATGPGWHFLTGSVDEIRRVCASFGVEFWPDEGLITHTLQTAVIDREGRLAAAVEGKDYSGRQLGDLVQRALDRD